MPPRLDSEAESETSYIFHSISGKTGTLHGWLSSPLRQGGDEVRVIRVRWKRERPLRAALTPLGPSRAVGRRSVRPIKEL